MPSPSPKDLSRILADIDKQIAKAEKLTVQPSDYEALERASKVLRELREQRRDVEMKLQMGSEGQSTTERKPKYWFPAKRYGWGWGPPQTWQGWLVAIAWVVILYLVSDWLVTRNQMVALFVFVAAMIAVLALIGYLKGEPPRWRWGGK
jgi:hypothetical protein